MKTASRCHGVFECEGSFWRQSGKGWSSGGGGSDLVGVEDELEDTSDSYGGLGRATLVVVVLCKKRLDEVGEPCSIMKEVAPWMSCRTVKEASLGVSIAEAGTVAVPSLENPRVPYRKQPLDRNGQQNWSRLVLPWHRPSRR